MSDQDFEASIAPFRWVEHEGSASVVLEAGNFRPEIFATRADEGFEGGGYDWASLAQVFLDERQPGLREVVQFDPEASMFCAYSSDASALRTFVTSFKATCEDDAVIQDLFSRAELD